jgi:hypothetical protein
MLIAPQNSSATPQSDYSATLPKTAISVED